MHALDGLDLSDLDLFRDGIPHQIFATLRHRAPVFHNPGHDGEGFWALTRYQDVARVNRDHERFSSERRGIMMFDQTSLDEPDQPRMMIEIDPPRHTRYRLLVNRGFTPRMVSMLESRMRDIARRTVDRVVDAGSCDFATEVANALPVQIISEIMGVPASDQAYVEEMSDRIQAGAAAGATGAGIAVAAIVELCEYANRLAADKRRTLGPQPDPHDVVATLLSADIDGQALTDSEFGLFFLLLTVAGNETTRSALSGGALALAEHPEEFARLRNDPGLVPSAVEEILRWTSPILYMARSPTEDVEISGQPILAGERIVLWYASANYDEAVFPDPMRFDVGRTPNDHIAFGAGPHFCLGSNIARIEIAVMLREILTRLPKLEQAGEAKWLESNFISGPKHLPVRF
jgi:cholest-4-en-3-one 26-monooxygenase